MKRLMLILITLAILSACTPDQAPRPDDIVTNEDPMVPKTDDTLPRPADSGLTRGAVYLDSVDLLTMESYPLQFSLALTGNLPTPCNKLRVDVNPPDADNKIVVDVYSVSAPDAVCIQMLEPFSANVPLGSFPPGHYTLWVNGEKVAEFDG